jgi:hypothetical protein
MSRLAVRQYARCATLLAYLNGIGFKTRKNYGKRDEVGQGGTKKRSATRWADFGQKEKRDTFGLIRTKKREICEQKKRSATNQRKFAHKKRRTATNLRKLVTQKKGIDQCRKSAKSVRIHSGRR